MSDFEIVLHPTTEVRDINAVAPYLLDEDQDIQPMGVFLLPVCTTRERLDKMLAALHHGSHITHHEDNEHIVDIWEAMAHINKPMEVGCFMLQFRVEDCVLQYRTTVGGEETPWTNLVDLTVCQPTPRLPEFRNVDGEDGCKTIQWRYTDEPDTAWRDLITICPPESDTSIQLRAVPDGDCKRIEVRYSETQDWQTLTTICDGEDAPRVVMRGREAGRENFIDWKYENEPDSAYRQLINVEDGRTPEFRVGQRPSPVPSATASANINNASAPNVLDASDATFWQAPAGTSILTITQSQDDDADAIEVRPIAGSAISSIAVELRNAAGTSLWTNTFSYTPAVAGFPTTLVLALPDIDFRSARLTFTVGAGGTQIGTVRIVDSEQWIQWKYTDEGATAWRDLFRIEGGMNVFPQNIQLRAQGEWIQWKYELEPDTAWRNLHQIPTDGLTPEMSAIVNGGTRTIRWKYTSEPDTAWRFLVSVQDGEDGRTPTFRFRASPRTVQWRYTDEADTVWRDLYNPVDGRTPQIRTHAGRVQWKYDDESASEWRDLFEIPTSGRTPQIRTQDRMLQWKYEDEPNTEWRDLYELPAPTDPAPREKLRLIDTNTFWRVEREYGPDDWRLEFNIPRPKLKLENCNLVWTDGRQNETSLYNFRLDPCQRDETQAPPPVPTDEESRCAIAYFMARRYADMMTAFVNMVEQKGYFTIRGGTVEAWLGEKGDIRRFFDPYFAYTNPNTTDFYDAVWGTENVLGLYNELEFKPYWSEEAIIAGNRLPILDEFTCRILSRLRDGENIADAMRGAGQDMRTFTEDSLDEDWGILLRNLINQIDDRDFQLNARQYANRAGADCDVCPEPPPPPPPPPPAYPWLKCQDGNFYYIVFPEGTNSITFTLDRRPEDLSWPVFDVNYIVHNGTDCSLGGNGQERTDRQIRNAGGLYTLNFSGEGRAAIRIEAPGILDLDSVVFN